MRALLQEHAAHVLSGADVEAALKTYVPTGKMDEYYIFASGGQSGNVDVIGVPSMRLLKVIGVFTPESWQGWGFGGDSDTPQAAGYAGLEGTGFALTGTAVARYCFDTSDWDNSGWVVPLGSSGHPGSPHYADQVEAWREVRLVPMRYDWDRIAREAETVQKLSPA